MQRILTKLSEKQLQTIYSLGTRRQYKEESVDNVVDRIIEHSRENLPVEATMADLRRLASTSGSFHDFTEAIDDIRTRLQ